MLESRLIIFTADCSKPTKPLFGSFSDERFKLRKIIALLELTLSRF